MIYEVTAKLLFKTKKASKEFYRTCELALSKATSINTDRPNAEYSSIRRILSNHDLDPNQPSELLGEQTNQPPKP